MTKREKTTKENKKRRACIRLHKKLPQILERIDTQLSHKNLTQRKVSAAVVLIMHKLMIRVGSEKSRTEHDHYGITTLLPQHVTVTGDTVQFQFVGKAGVPWNRSLADSRIAKIISELKAGAENQLFWYKDGTKQVDLTDNDIRDWLAPFNVNPKDLRTHKANLLMYEELMARATQGLSRSAARVEVRETFDLVAEHLGHQPATCRGQYVFPALWKGFVETGGQVPTGPFGVQ